MTPHNRFSTDYYTEGVRVTRVPEELHEGLIAYILHGQSPGGFLTAVLCNDLQDACQRADMTNRYRLFDIVNFLYNYAPPVAYGNGEKVSTWIAKHGMEQYADVVEKA